MKKRKRYGSLQKNQQEKFIEKKTKKKQREQQPLLTGHQKLDIYIKFLFLVSRIKRCHNPIIIYRDRNQRAQIIKYDEAIS